MNTSIKISANLPVIGTVSPYSYQVKPKTWDRSSSVKQVSWGGEARPSRLTKGQGKGANVRFYAYFMDGDFQHWLELPQATYQELLMNPGTVLELTREDGVVDAPAPAVEQAPKTKAKRVKRETAAA